MIDVKELRIGNLVICKNEICRINMINRGDVVEVSTIDSDSVKECLACEIMSDRLYPITLTEELILKCGFEELYSDSKGYVYDINGVKFLRCYFDTPSFFIETDEDNKLFDKPIDNLHQLQNLYFDLTGKELEVTL